jgi:hypothetical protein
VNGQTDQNRRSAQLANFDLRGEARSLRLPDPSGLHQHVGVALERMTMDDIISFVDALDGVLTQRAHAGDGSPEIAWGDTFFYYAPADVVPGATQPFATIVTKNYPGDESSRLDRPGVFRVNMAAGRDAFLAHTGRAPRETAVIDPDAPGPDALDAVIAHPVYGSLGWLAVNNPGPATGAEVRRLLERAHELARARYLRRS